MGRVKKLLSRRRRTSSRCSDWTFNVEGPPGLVFNGGGPRSGFDYLGLLAGRRRAGHDLSADPLPRAHPVLQGRGLGETALEKLLRRTGARGFGPSGAVAGDQLVLGQFTQAGRQFGERDVDGSVDVAEVPGGLA